METRARVRPDERHALRNVAENSLNFLRCLGIVASRGKGGTKVPKLELGNQESWSLAARSRAIACHQSSADQSLLRLREQARPALRRIGDVSHAGSRLSVVERARLSNRGFQPPRGYQDARTTGQPLIRQGKGTGDRRGPGRPFGLADRAPRSLRRACGSRGLGWGRKPARKAQSGRTGCSHDAATEARDQHKAVPFSWGIRRLAGSPPASRDMRGEASMSSAISRYPSDLTDVEWKAIHPCIPSSRPVGVARQVSMRAVVNAIRYRRRSGCSWRLLPHDFPHWRTVYGYYRQWQRDGTWQQIEAAARGARR